MKNHEPEPQWRCFSDPQKLQYQMLLSEAAKFGANLWQQQMANISDNMGKMYVHFYVKEQVIKKTSLISWFLYTTHLFVVLIVVFLF